MNGFKKILMSTVATLVLAGCASTTENNEPVTYPVLKVLSDKPYVWDDSISEALNVARMAQPAKVGNGMRDFVDGKKANSGRITSGERLFDAGLGLLGQGLFGVVSMEALNSGVNRQLEWNPAVVLPVNKEQVLTGTDLDFLKVRNVIADKLIEALKADVEDFELIGVFTTKHHKQALNDSSVVFKTKKCNDSAKFDAYYNDKAVVKPLGVFDSFIEGPIELNYFCAVGFKTSVTSPVNDQYVLVAEMFGTTFSSSFFDVIIAKNIKGYFIIPEYYEYFTSDRFGVKKSIVSPYARVMKDGKELLFQSK